MFLEIMPFAGNICRDFDAVRQTDTGHFPQCGIRLLRRCRVHSSANSPFLRGSVQGRSLALPSDLVAAKAYELVNSRQNVLLLDFDEA